MKRSNIVNSIINSPYYSQGYEKGYLDALSIHY